MTIPHSVLDGHPKPIREALLSLRKLIHETAIETEGVGEIEEALTHRLRKKRDRKK